MQLVGGNGAHVLHDSHLVVIGKTIKRDSHHRSVSLFQTNNTGSGLFYEAGFNRILSSAVSPNLETKIIFRGLFSFFICFISWSSFVSRGVIFIESEIVYIVISLVTKSTGVVKSEIVYSVISFLCRSFIFFESEVV